MTYTREGEILKCPWRQWEFDIKTGHALYDPKLRVRTCRVEVACAGRSIRLKFVEFYFPI